MNSSNPFTSTTTYNPPLNPITVLTEHSNTTHNQLIADSQYDREAVGFDGVPEYKKPKRQILTKWERGVLPKEHFADPFNSIHFIYNIYNVDTTKQIKFLIFTFLFFLFAIFFIRYKKL